MRIRSLALAVASIALTGCWHITVTTNAQPSPTVVHEGWQSTWIYGLVPPPELNVKDKCPNGAVSKVETQMSPANVGVIVLISAVTLGLGGWIWHPVDAKVTCAAR